MAHHYDELPLPPTAFGHALYLRGQALVREHGVRLDTLVWDADEVLWDWVMPAGELLLAVGKAMVGNFGHTEWIAPRPGMRELLWGMHHASLDLGLDPYMRIWTSGYPWRLWEIFARAGGFVELLGPTPSESHPLTHPHILTRLDFVEAMGRLFQHADWEQHLGARSPEVQAEMAAILRSRPRDSGSKMPELAAYLGRSEFAKAEILIDDAALNVAAFRATARSAIHVKSLRPKWGGLIPFAASKPKLCLDEVLSDVAFEIAAALERLSKASSPRVETAVMRALPESERTPDAPQHDPFFSIQIPNPILQAQWIQPIKRVGKAPR